MRTKELPETESREVEQHLETCNSCHESLGDVEEFADVIKVVCSTPREEVRCVDSFGSLEVDGQLVWVAFTERGVKRIDLASKSADEFRERYREQFDRVACQKEVPEKVAKAVSDVLHGETPKLPELDLEALSEFERECLTIIRSIPRGEVRTYEWVARAAGRPKATRAVGNVMATNPIPLLLPCHRVVPTSGGLGNYGYGPAMKRRLLAAEHVPVEELEALGRKGVRYVGSRTTKIFCFPTCRDARRIREENRVPFHDAGEAADAGFRPCQRCAPVVAA